ncbi:hypothetical protein QF037_009994 [Streptomyces canus]|uniref:zeta toxin family protein n=1 Tax=Streptomyces canus TaxID=58343 RepID=UPI00277D88C9|nr:zeta toxin family protein [Streptomyces canus]MDQ0605561.1 hypothetical protein [Streptomyces canus]
MNDRRGDGMFGAGIVSADFTVSGCEADCRCPTVRLPRQQLDQIFHEQIVGLLLGEPVSQVRPVALYIMGQPGAGKTTITLRIMDAQEVREAVRICTDDLKQFHPWYEALMRHNSRTAGARIRRDLKAWQRMVKRFVAQHRAHAVIEIAPGEPEEFFRSAAAFHALGYEVKLVPMAVRAADSFQGVTVRFAETRTPDMPARFTTREGHHRCFAAVAETLRLAEAAAVVGPIMVVNRGGYPLWSPRRRYQQSAVEALLEERNRLYTTDEAIEFVKIQEWLWSELPAHRDEIAESYELARPMLPKGSRPID